MDERYFSQNGITVDRDFARFGSKSYAINKINSVELRERQKGNVGCTVLSCIVTLFFIFALINEFNSVALIIALFFALAAAGSMWLQSQREYSLYLMTSSSEVQALTSNSREEIEKLRAAIERAMVG